MNKKILMALFAAVAIFQLAIPGYVVVRANRVVETGTAFKFKMRQFDPGDPFRGNYLQLSFQQEGALHFSGRHVGTVYVSVSAAEDGFAKVEDSLERPESGPYFVASDRSGWRSSFPFNRYFINEAQAKRAEEMVNSAVRNGDTGTYALVKVGRGSAVLIDLYVYDKPLRQLLAD